MQVPSKVGFLVKLAIAATSLAAVLGILLLVPSSVALFFLAPLAAILAAIVAGLLAALALTDTILRRDRGECLRHPVGVWYDGHSPVGTSAVRRR